MKLGKPSIHVHESSDVCDDIKIKYDVLWDQPDIDIDLFCYVLVEMYHYKVDVSYYYNDMAKHPYRRIDITPSDSVYEQEKHIRAAIDIATK